MKKYNEYMDGITVSDTLHEKLRNLEQPKKRPQVWKKYGAMAAALVLVLGLGGWGLSRRDSGEIGQEMAEGPVASMPAIIEITTEPAPVPMPNSPGMEMMGGYEVNYGESVAYFYLPAINYGEVTEIGDVSLALPVGAEIRDLTPEEIEALLGGEINLTAHLDWGDYEVSAHAVLWPDDTMWMLCVSGIKGDTGLEHFLLEVSSGQLPADCAFYPNSEMNNIWERDVWAASCDTNIGSARQVTFVDREYHYRFEITGIKGGEIEELVSRLVRFIIAGGGLTFEKEEPAVNSGEMNTMPYDPMDTPPVPTPASTITAEPN